MPPYPILYQTGEHQHGGGHVFNPTLNAFDNNNSNQLFIDQNLIITVDNNQRSKATTRRLCHYLIHLIRILSLIEARVIPSQILIVIIIIACYLTTRIVIIIIIQLELIQVVMVVLLIRRIIAIITFIHCLIRQIIT